MTGPKLFQTPHGDAKLCLLLVNIVSDAKYFIVRKRQPKFPSCIYLMLSRSMEASLLGKGLLRKVCLQMFDIVLLLLAGFFLRSLFFIYIALG